MESERKPVPLRVAIEQVSRDEDRFIHQLTIGISGADGDVIVVDIESDCFEWPRIHMYYVDLLGLPLRLTDALAFKVYGLLTGTMLQYDSDRGWHVMHDCTRWIETHFLSSEARLVLTAVLSHVPKPELVQNAGDSGTSEMLPK